MMKIHTTQNLNSLVQNRQSTNIVSSKDFRLKNYSKYTQKPDEPASADFYSSSVTFGKKATAREVKKIIKASKKIAGDISREPNPKKKWSDGVIENPLFNWVLSKYDYEPVIQAAAAAIICMALRPATIMALPAKGKNKEDNVYASSHSFASGTMGLVAAIIVTAPAKTSGKYVMEVMRKGFKTNTLEHMYPQLNINSIWADKTKGIRKPVEDWLNKDGNKFIDSTDKIQFLPEFKQLANTSDLSFKDILKLDIDWASQKGKSFNDIVTRDGSKIYDKLSMDHVGIVVTEDMGSAFKKEKDRYKNVQILLKDIDRDYLKELINDSKGTNWGNLDIKSVYGQDGAVKDFREWKDINGNNWKLDLDEIYVSSPLEEIKQLPRISGKKRFDSHDKEYKHVVYQDNGKNGKLGTEVTNEMADVSRANAAIDKLQTWGPDIITRIPIAATTIALIPWTLKNVFGIEKSKKKKADKVQKTQNEEIKQNTTVENPSKENVSFKGKDPKKVSWLTKLIAKYYGKPIMESETIRKIATSLSKLPGKLTEHMMTLGSFITSSVYMNRTLQNDDLDPERKKTLAVNQGLCFLIPTIAAYTVNILLDKKIKNFEYRISNKGQFEKAMAEYVGRPLAKWYTKNQGNAKGLRILTSIGIFSLIYRYITPVLVTPLANKISDRYFTNDNKDAEDDDNETAKEIKLEPINTSENNAQVAKEISINGDNKKEIRQSA